MSDLTNSGHMSEHKRVLLFADCYNEVFLGQVMQLSQTYPNMLVLALRPDAHYFLSKVDGLDVRGVHEIISTVDVENNLHDVSFSFIDSLCKRLSGELKDDCYSCAHFELKRAVDPLLVNELLIKATLEDFNPDLILTSDRQFSGRFQEDTYDEEEGVFQSVLAEYTQGEAFPMLTLIPSGLKTTQTKQFSLKQRCKLEVKRALALKNLVRSGKSVVALQVGRGLEDVLSTFAKKHRYNLINLKDILSLKFADVRANFDPDNIDIDESLKAQIVHIIGAELGCFDTRIKNLLGKVILDFMLLVRLLDQAVNRVLSGFLFRRLDVVAVASLSYSSLANRLIARHFKSKGVKIVSYTHLLEGHFEHKMVHYIDTIMCDHKLIGGDGALQKNLNPSYYRTPEVHSVGQLMFYKVAKYIRENYSDRQHKKIRVVYLLYTYPEANYLISRYRMLPTEMFKQHAEFLRGWGKQSSQDIELVLRPYQGQPVQVELLEQLISECALNNVTIDLDTPLNALMLTADTILLDTVTTSFGEASLFPANIVVNNQIFNIKPESRDDLLSRSTIVDNASDMLKATLNRKSEINLDDALNNRFMKKYAMGAKGTYSDVVNATSDTLYHVLTS